MVLRRAKTTAEAAAPGAKRSRKTGRRARRRIPGLGLVLALGLVPDLELRNGQSSLRVTTREASPRGPLAPPLTLLILNLEPGLNLNPSLSPSLPRLLKLAPTPAPSHALCPAPSPVPRLVLAPVLVLSSAVGLFVTSPCPDVSPCPVTFPKSHNTTPAPGF